MKSLYKALFLTGITLSTAIGCSKNPASENSPSEPTEQQSPVPEHSTPSTNTPTPITAPGKENATQALPPPTDELNNNPVLIHHPDPVYPKELQDRAVEGEVCVLMRVTAEGKAEDVKVTHSTDPAFEAALLNSMSAWQFKPAHRNGVAVARTVSIAIPFVIGDRVNCLPTMDSRLPELVGIVRPPHPHKGTASALLEIKLSPEAFIVGISIVKSEGTIDRDAIINAVAQWVFFPPRNPDQAVQATAVKAEIIFTESNNVLIQYPHPAPKAVLDKN